MAEDKQLLVPLDMYLKVGLHIGTKYKTKYMEPFIYKIRPDGLAVMNVQKIDERIGLAAKFLSHYDPSEILIVCRRENGQKAVKLFSKITGIRSFAGRYPPGILTNSNLETFTEAKIMLITDPWPDKNAIKDAVRSGIPVVGLCDTNNEANYLDLMVPMNNKGRKSLALFFYILAKEYQKLKGKIKNDSDFKYTLDDFTPD
jgi:small subunit ribosomal protein S2|tara:strand:+ start:13374 stop:13976 length:603 start_codon:yes stop_codon:yes gene_type:complete